MCRVIGVSNQKGGVAKSSCAFNLGIGLARQGKKVLIVDLDPQRFSDCKYGGSGTGGYTIYDCGYHDGNDKCTDSKSQLFVLKKNDGTNKFSG